MTKRSSLRLAKAALTLSALGLCFNAFAETQIKLRVIETTDIHSYLTAYDYFKDAPVNNYGLTRAASLIKEARSEVTNSVLVDNGDLIQGSLIGEWAVNNKLEATKGIHPAHVAMNTLGYTVGNIGNHEFNFGLDYLNKTIKGANFPYLNANVYDAKTHQNYFTPYVIKETELVDSDGNKQKVRIGYIGFTPPGIMRWDADKLTGKVYAEDIYETAQKFVPLMKEQGADVIIAIPHSGIGSQNIIKLAENQAANLTTVKGIDAVTFGHSHAVFPSEEFKTIPGADITRGTINGIPAVMPGRWADHIGVVDLVLTKNEYGRWTVDHQYSTASTRAIYDAKAKKPIVQDDPTVAKSLEQVHEATRKYAAAPIGQLKDNLYGYLSLTQDDYAVKLVNQAQLYAAQKWQAANPEYKDYKVVSAGAPFKFGERHNDVTNFTAVDAGTFALRNVSDVYVYPNTFYIVKATGAEVRDWLECSAGQFNTIDPNKTERQDLINYQYFRTYNFDNIYGVTYQYDVTQAPKFTTSCKVPKDGVARGNRVVDLRYNGEPVKDTDMFLVATNNYRATGGSFAGTGADHIVYAGLETNQEVVSDYVKQATLSKGSFEVDKAYNWSLKPITNGEKLNIVMYSAPDEKAMKFVMENSEWKVEKLGHDSEGFQEYRIDLSKKIK